VKWSIEGDIKGCFDNINHDKLIGVLEEKIRGNRFLRLIRNLLEAGFMEDWRYNVTYSGTPQGGIISPILNIYLDKLDKYVTEVLIPKHTKGIERRRNKEYESLKRKDLKPWEKWMAAKRRKTLVVCKKCHVEIHTGKLQRATDTGKTESS
jgi:retron-type reverse transcriptase